MLSKLFGTSDQRRDREVRQAYEACIDVVRRRKRQFRRNAAVKFTTAYPACSFLMNDLTPEFLVLDRVGPAMVEGKFIDHYIKKPEYVPESESVDARLAAITSYRDAVKITDVLPFRKLSPEDERWFRNGTLLESIDIVPDGFASRKQPVEGVLYATVKRNGAVVCAINAFSPKPHLYFASYLPTALQAFRVAALDRPSTLTVEVVTSGYHGRLFRYEHIYDDFNKLNVVGRADFISMTQMVVEFLTVVEQMTHDSRHELRLDDEEEASFHMDDVLRRVPDFQPY